MSFTRLLEQNALGLQLTPISLRELFFLSETPCEIYGVSEGLFKIKFRKLAPIDKNVLLELIENGQTQLFVKGPERKILIEVHQKLLREVTRSLSIGDPIEKGKKQLNLLSINMSYLYADPTNDEALSLQFQATRNLATFLYNRPETHVPLYTEYCKQKHHFIFAQPLLSSLFLVGILKQSSLLNEKDIENLFVTSYFKDIGMSAIPTEKYDEPELSPGDKKLLAKHPEFSIKILQGRSPLTPRQLKIIETHHSFSMLSREMKIQDSKDEEQLLSGFETMIVTITDIISAMIAERPYRSSTTLFEALELVKILIADEYPSEFRLMVAYFRQFFTKIPS